MAIVLKPTITISNKAIYTFMAVVVLLGISGIIFAYTTDGSGTPSVMGHSADELEISDKIYYRDVLLDGCDLGIPIVYCDSGDIAISGGGTCGYCDDVARIESLKRVSTDGWRIVCDENGDSVPDGGYVEVTCLKKS